MKKIWQPLLAALGAAILLKLGVLPLIAALVAASVIGYGPARMRSLPRPDRESAGLHLLGVLGASVASFVCGSFAGLVGASQIEALAALAAWMCLAAGVMIFGFHIACFPIVSRGRRAVPERPVQVPCPTLSKAG